MARQSPRDSKNEGEETWIGTDEAAVVVEKRRGKVVENAKNGDRINRWTNCYFIVPK